MKYSNFSSNNLILDTIKTLYESAFPENERRDFPTFVELLYDNNIPFEMIYSTINNEVVGFISYWNFDDVVYIEHFAMSESVRGNGLGTEFLQYFLSQNKFVILEAEPPVNEIGRRRINFYLRQGFVVHNEITYIQPAYEGRQSPGELKLLTYGEFTTEKLIDVVNIIKYNVYGVKQD